MAQYTCTTWLFLFLYSIINHFCSSTNEIKNYPNYPLSIYQMNQLLEIDNEVIMKMKISKSSQNITTRQKEICQNFINEWKILPQKSRQESIQNILMIHQIIKRYYDFPKHLLHEIYLDLEEIFSQKNAKWPGDEDLLESIDSINRLVDHYDLEPKYARDGQFGPGSKGIKLNAFTCSQIGTRALNLHKFALAYKWFELARNILLTENDWSISLKEVEKGFSLAINEHDQNFYQFKGLFPKLFFNTTILPYKEGKKLFRLLSNGAENLSQNKKNQLVYKALCKGENLMAEKERSQLYCQYRHFYLRIRVEILSKDPEIIQIYNFFANDEPIENFKEVALKSLAPSAVMKKISEDPFNNVVSIDTRSSHSTFLEIYNNKWSQMAENRIALITGLEVKQKYSSEFFQVAAYAPGGHYGFHSDSFGDLLEQNNTFGERIATFMIYLSDVKIGGSTAFIQGRVAARPIKGSAVFWWNQNKDGTILENVSHGGCPVIEGHKWITNKWIHYPAQFKNLPCELEPGK